MQENHMIVLGNVIGLTLSIPVVAAELDCEDADEVNLAQL